MYLRRNIKICPSLTHLTLNLHYYYCKSEISMVKYRVDYYIIPFAKRFSANGIL